MYRESKTNHVCLNIVSVDEIDCKGGTEDTCMKAKPITAPDFEGVSRNEDSPVYDQTLVFIMDGFFGLPTYGPMLVQDFLAEQRHIGLLCCLFFVSFRNTLRTCSIATNSCAVSLEINRGMCQELTQQ